MSFKRKLQNTDSLTISCINIQGGLITNCQPLRYKISDNIARSLQISTLTIYKEQGVSITSYQ